MLPRVDSIDLEADFETAMRRNKAYVREERLAASHAGCHREGTHAGAAR